MKRINASFFLICLFGFTACCQAQQISSNIRSLLSTEGKVLYGNEPNSIMVIDYPENVQQVGDYLANADTAPDQVMIEARVVEVTLDNEHALGVNWMLFADKGYLPVGRFTLGDAEKVGVSPGPLEQHFSFKSVESPFTFGIFDDNINVVVKTLATTLDTNILSAPRITTVNNREAVMKVIERVPWAEPEETTDENGNITLSWTINWEEIGISLRVLPTINEDGTITMLLNPSVSEQTGEITLDTGSLEYEIPIIDQRDASTKVIIGDKQTLIIGGLIKDKIVKDETKIPLLGDLPGLGHFFKSTQETREKTELMIFVSPTIIRPEVFVHMAKQERYVYGRGYTKDLQDKEKLILQRELEEKNKQEEQVSTLESLHKKLENLIDERKKLEQDVVKQEQGLQEFQQQRNQQSGN